MTPKSELQKRVKHDPIDAFFSELISILSKGGIFLGSLLWVKFIDRYGHIFGLLNKKELCIETFDLPSKWKTWEMPLFSHTLRKETDFRFIDFRINTLVMGTTGQGKNVLLDNIINERLEKSMPVLFVAPKGDMDDITKFKLLNHHHGREAVVVSDFVSFSDTYNPIANGSVASIVERIHSSFNWSEQYYSDCSYAALVEAISVIKGELDHFGDEKRGELSRISVVGNSTPTFRKIEDVLRLIYRPGSNAEKNVSGLINKISKINTSSFGSILNDESGWTISELREQKRSVIYSISNLKFPEISRMIGKIITLDLQNYVSEVYELDNNKRESLSPMAVVLDELGAVATESFASAFNQFRGAKINMIAGIQCLADLDSVGPLFKRIVISNTNNFFIGLIKDPEEAEFLSKMIGTKQAKKMTVKIENNEEMNLGSMREGHEFVISPDLLKNGNTGKFIVKTFLGQYNVSDIVSVNMKFTIGNLEILTKSKKRNLPLGSSVKNDSRILKNKKRIEGHGSLF